MKDIFEKTLCDFDKRKYKLNALGIGTKYGITNKYGIDIHEGEGLKFVRETDNGDVVILEESPIYKDQLYFVCIGYDNDKEKVKFKRHFTPYINSKTSEDKYYKNIFLTDHIFIIPEEGKTTVYNSDNNKVAVLNKFIAKIEDDKIVCRSKITRGNYEDNLTMILNPKTLEAPSFYSELQDDNIPIMSKEEAARRESNDKFETTFSYRLALTYYDNAVKYVEYLDNTDMNKGKTR